MASVEDRVRRLEDKDQIRELVGRYGFMVDNRDIPALRDLFTDDAQVKSKDGKHASEGIEQIMKQYDTRFSVLGPTNHFTHNHVIWFDENDPDHAYGLLNAHGELVRHGKAMMSALRYDDEYRRCPDGKWRFEKRMMSYFYYLQPDEISKYLPELNRMRAYDEPAPIDFPDRLDTYQKYYEEHPRQA
jgi:ketosteroid isomerase-like protein